MRSVPRHVRWCIGLVVVVAVAVITGYILLRGHSLDLRIMSLTVEDVKSYAEAWAPWSAVASIGLMVLHSFLPLPAEIIAVANGMMFGLVGGVLVTWVGAMLGATLSFAMARSLGRPTLRWLVSERRWRAIDGWEFRATTLLVARFIPVISFNLVNYGAGLARVGWWPFLWTTAVGILPLTVASVLLGDAMLRVNWAIAGTIIAGAAIVWLVLRHWRIQDMISDLFLPVSDPPDDKSNGRTRKHRRNRRFE